ncbi:GNAT family N-acetyltransferase [Ciceribacter sp. RN22]|uniref:GNAT family N-acetyltransferase n=1 Tax=Ciceribacter sp. RN22 TaxID=2954932 RepID=UPI002092AC65|nr:GNAT family N-acetyltransferase [Ciceribacter sp. RN22]MCO6177908.1 GNAT family N-acetyltransferase [Ciceribacter sp. RN22]
MNERFRAQPLTTDRWDDFEAVMGPRGACYDCWCTYFRLSPAERKSLAGSEKKDFMHRRVSAGPAPGLIGYLGDRPVGWVQVGPRADVPNWNSPRTVSRPLDEADAEDPTIWAVSCFFIVSKERGKGLSHQMLAAAVVHARAAAARVVDACPIERTKQSKSVGLYVGSRRIFEAAGFAEVASRKEGRPLMRLVL